MIKSVMKTNNFAEKSEIEKLCVAYQMNSLSATNTTQSLGQRF